MKDKDKESLELAYQIANEHIRYVEYKRRNKRPLSYSDMQLMFNAINCMILIDKVREIKGWTE